MVWFNYNSIFDAPCATSIEKIQLFWFQCPTFWLIIGWSIFALFLISSNFDCARLASVSTSSIFVQIPMWQKSETTYSTLKVGINPWVFLGPISEFHTFILPGYPAFISAINTSRVWDACFMEVFTVWSPSISKFCRWWRAWFPTRFTVSDDKFDDAMLLMAIR